jgi:hypothetical protein
VAEVLVEAGGSLQFGVGEEFEIKACVPNTVGARDRKRAQIAYALKLPAKALCGVDVPADELRELRGRMGKLAALRLK